MAPGSYPCHNAGTGPCSPACTPLLDARPAIYPRAARQEGSPGLVAPAPRPRRYSHRPPDGNCAGSPPASPAQRRCYTAGNACKPGHASFPANNNNRPGAVNQHPSVHPGAGHARHQHAPDLHLPATGGRFRHAIASLMPASPAILSSEARAKRPP